MVVTHKIRMDLEGKTPAPWIEVKQWDVYTREVRFQMFTQNKPWEIPENIRVLICYRKPDEKYGEYDTLPNGKTAWSAEGNMLWVTLTSQILTTPGKVYLQICMIQEDRILHTFPLEIYVRSAGKGKKGMVSDDYYFMTGVLPAPVQAEIGQFIRVLAVDERGRVLRVEAVEAPDSRAVSEQQVQDIVEEYLKNNPPVPGKDGISPEAQVVQTETGAVITMTDQNGTTSATIKNGKDGIDGDKGDKGDKGDVGTPGEKGEKGDPGVYILSEGETIADAPADAEVVIDPNGEAVEVIPAPKMAAVGQTIVVKAVDASGKPTEWETADFPEGGGASSWEELGSSFEQGVVLAETNPVFVEDEGMFALMDAVKLPATGKEYTVNWNGTEYFSVCEEYVEEGALIGRMLGNTSAVGGTQENDSPFVIIFPFEAMEEGITGIILPLDGSTELTISITGEVEKITPLPEKYLPPTQFAVTFTVHADSSITSDKTYMQVLNALKAKKCPIIGYLESDMNGNVVCMPIYKWYESDGEFEFLQITASVSDIDTWVLRLHADDSITFEDL